MQNQEDVLANAARVLGISLRETEDVLTRDLLRATASYINCTDGVNGDVPTELTASDLTNVAVTLLDNDAYTITENIEGENKFGTAPIRDAFLMMSNTKIAKDLERIPDFVSKNSYPSTAAGIRSEYGAYNNIRILLSSLGSSSVAASTKGATVYNNFVMGMNAYSVIEQNGASAEFIYRPAMYSGPLALNVTTGYKFSYAGAILQDLHILNLRSTLRN